MMDFHVLVSYDAIFRLEIVCKKMFFMGRPTMEKCHFLVSNLAFLRDLVHIKQGRHAVFQCTSNTKMALDWKSSVEKYCYI